MPTTPSSAPPARQAAAPASPQPSTLTSALNSALAAIAPARDPALASQLQSRLDLLTKPQGSLGRLEALAAQIGQIQRQSHPRLDAPAMLLFAADHGIAGEGVSAYPRAVTAQMVANIVGGGAAVSVLCRQHGIPLTLTDVGVLPGGPVPLESRGLRLVLARLADGTADMRQGPAMTVAECLHAIAIGRQRVAESDADAILLGEMGIGNTSSAALLTAWSCGIPVEACTGRGTGLNDAGLARKRQILAEVLARHHDISDPLEALATLGGLEIAAMVGAILEAAGRRRLVVIDGFIVTAALLMAWRLAPAVLDYAVVSHRSSELGHSAALARLGVTPLLDLDLRLGEGSGAALAWPVIRSSLLLLEQMATFESAGVSSKSTTR